MGRRGWGEGGIRERTDRPEGSATRFVAEVSMGVDANGKRVRRTFYGVDKADVRRKLKEALAHQQRGTLSAVRMPTVADHLAAWLAGVDVKPSTRMRYANLIRCHISPAVGKVRLDELTHEHVKGMLAAVVAAGGAPRTANHCRAVLRTALNSGIKSYPSMTRNAAALAEPRRVEERKVWTPSPAQLPTFIAALESDPHHGALFVTTLMLGLRQGEALALRWSDISFEEAKVHINGALQRVDGVLTRLSPKTSESHRTLEMSPTVRRILVEHRERQMAILSSAWGDINGYVFTSVHGRPLDASYVTHAFQRTLARAGLPRMRYHDLRHACATLMAAAGAAPKVVQQQLGHADITTTLRVYTHVTGEAMREAATMLDRLASPASTGS